MKGEVTYGIWFEPTANGSGQLLNDGFHSRDVVAGIVEHYNRRIRGERNYNPAWNGIFSVVEFLNGRPTP